MTQLPAAAGGGGEDRAARLLQVEHHACLSQQRLLDYTRQHGIVLTSYTLVAKGAVLEDQVIWRIAARSGATPAQVALALAPGDTWHAGHSQGRLPRRSDGKIRGRRRW
jgi:diketogulonate reductase-like aldo/keto reductase